MESQCYLPLDTGERYSYTVPVAVLIFKVIQSE